MNIYTLARLATIEPEIVEGDPSQIERSATSGRVFYALEQALKGKLPSMFFKTLMKYGVLEDFFLELAQKSEEERKNIFCFIDRVSIGEGGDPVLPFVALCYYLSMKEIFMLCERISVPSRWFIAATVAKRFIPDLKKFPTMKDEESRNLFILVRQYFPEEMEGLLSIGLLSGEIDQKIANLILREYENFKRKLSTDLCSFSSG